MDLDKALRQLLDRYRRAVIDADGDDEAEDMAVRRRDAIAGILGHRYRVRERATKAQRMDDQRLLYDHW